MVVVFTNPHPTNFLLSIFVSTSSTTSELIQHLLFNIQISFSNFFLSVVGVLTNPHPTSKFLFRISIFEFFKSNIQSRCIGTKFKICYLIFKFRISHSFYSHSIVAGGLLLISYTTRLMPFTSLIMRFDTCAKNSCGK